LDFHFIFVIISLVFIVVVFCWELLVVGIVVGILLGFGHCHLVVHGIRDYW